MHSNDPQATRSIESSGPERVKSAVVAAARRLFAEKGIHAVSVREIAREVGVSHTLLHLYFGSKEEILRQVLSSDPTDTDALEGATKPGEASENVFRALMANPDQVRVLAAAIMEGFVPGKIDFDPTLSKQLAAHIAGTGSGESATDPRMVSAMIASTAIGWAVAGDWISGTVGLSADDRDHVVAQMLGQAVDHLS